MKKIRLNKKKTADNHLKICVLCVTHGLNYEWDQSTLAHMMDSIERERHASEGDAWDFEFGKEGKQCEGCAFVGEHTALNFSDKLAEGEPNGEQTKSR
jgi:hypothetical protein